MTLVPNTASPNVPNLNDPSEPVEAIPAGGADPDFVALERSKSAVCSIPVLGKMLPQCK